jgi:hypothetical protein
MLLTEARFIKPAELEFEEAFDHYAGERPDLGQLSTDVATTVEAAAGFTGSPGSDSIRSERSPCGGLAVPAP